MSGFTLHAVLEAVADTAPGLAGDALLPSLPVILDVFLEELVGEIADEKVCYPAKDCFCPIWRHCPASCLVASTTPAPLCYFVWSPTPSH